MACGQVLVVLPIEGVASLYQDLYNLRFHQISLGESVTSITSVSWVWEAQRTRTLR